MRAPDNLSHAEVKKSLEELDNKIKVLKGRANATTADSNNTYHEHIAALERKRELLSQKMGVQEQTSSTWQDIRNSIDKLKNDVDNFFR